jgi:putative PIN family toxin of toxin-antitoxin system
VEFPGVEYFDASIEGGAIVLKPVNLRAEGSPPAVACVKVVLDTDAFASSLLFKGPVSAIHAAWTEARFIPLVSGPVLEEYARVLAYPKFDLSEPDIAGLLGSELLRHAEPVDVASRVNAVKADPPDNRFPELAGEGGADFIVSVDRHLLDLGSRRGIPILGAREFLDRQGWQAFPRKRAS